MPRILPTRRAACVRSRAALSGLLMTGMLGGFVVANAAPPAASKPGGFKSASGKSTVVSKPGEAAVDLFELRKPALTLRGLVVARNEESRVVTVAVRREWLERTAPEFYAEYRKKETDARRAALPELERRIDAWLERRGGDAPRDGDRLLVRFLRDQKDRIAKLRTKNDGDVAPVETPFVLFDIAEKDLKKSTLVAPDVRQVALVAFAEELPDVERRSPADLRAALKKDSIDPEKRIVAATAWLPPRRDTEAEWAARQAIVEYDQRQAIDFQGTGDAYFRTGEGAPAPALAELIGAMLKSQLAGGLLDLLEDGPRKPKQPSGPPAVLSTLEKGGILGARVTTLDQDAAARRVTVRTTFWARLPDVEARQPETRQPESRQPDATGRWREVFVWTETADASKARPDAEARIERDPQVKKVFELIANLVPGAEGEQAARTAIRFGAAVMEAQQAADARFISFRDTYLKSLEGPPLSLTSPR